VPLVPPREPRSVYLVPSLLRPCIHRCRRRKHHRELRPSPPWKRTARACVLLHDTMRHGQPQPRRFWSSLVVKNGSKCAASRRPDAAPCVLDRTSSARPSFELRRHLQHAPLGMASDALPSAPGTPAASVGGRTGPGKAGARLVFSSILWPKLELCFTSEMAPPTMVLRSLGSRLLGAPGEREQVLHRAPTLAFAPDGAKLIGISSRSANSCFVAAQHQVGILRIEQRIVDLVRPVAPACPPRPFFRSQQRLCTL